jgi:uncharacterized membrane protein YphA (DoxX/SURF4 family)
MKNSSPPPRSRSIIYWIVSAVAAALFAVPGTALVAHVPHFAEEMGRLGYPSYFLYLLGVPKVLAAAVIIAPGLPRLKEWAYAGMMFDIIGAIVSHTAAGDGAGTVVMPVVIGCLVITSWALRPASRKLFPIGSAPDVSLDTRAAQRAR